jgi:hypothetical protein
MWNYKFIEITIETLLVNAGAFCGRVIAGRNILMICKQIMQVYLWSDA